MRQSVSSAMVDFVMEAADEDDHAKTATRYGMDGLEVNAQDLSVNALFHKRFKGFGYWRVAEEDKPTNHGRRSLLVCDPNDGSAMRARGEHGWTVAINRYDDGMCTGSVVGGWGMQADWFDPSKGSLYGYRRREGRGLLLYSDRHLYKNLLRPLEHSMRELMGTPLPMVEPGELTAKSVLLVTPTVRMVQGYMENIRVVTEESTVAAQVRVALGKAQGCLFGLSEPWRERKPTDIGPKLWDMIPSIVQYAGLVYVLATGRDKGRVEAWDGILGLFDRDYYLTGQLLVCHPEHAGELLARVDEVKGMMNYCPL